MVRSMIRYSKEQLKWIEDNLDVGVFRNQKHFTDVFNALFGMSITSQQMSELLYRRGWRLKTEFNRPKWTEEQDEWLKEKYAEIGSDFTAMADEFNAVFGTDKSNSCIAKHLLRAGIHKPAQKKGHYNKGAFKPGQPNVKGELPIGTIRYNSDGTPYIKVKLCNGENRHGDGGHNYKKPWWKPLQETIWEDNYGEVPEGYMVCSLSGKRGETDPNMLVLLDKRMNARMAKNNWWNADHPEIKRAAAAWCKLYYTVKDAEGK